MHGKFYADQHFTGLARLWRHCAPVIYAESMFQSAEAAVIFSAFDIIQRTAGQ